MSITSANASLSLQVAGIFTSPQALHQFGADDIYGVDDLEVAETAMGVDGFLTGGMVFNAVKQRITLMADSNSMYVFDTWNAQQRAQEDIFIAQGIVILKTLGTKWTMANGILTNWKPMPDAKKLLQARTFTITWESVTPAPS